MKLQFREVQIQFLAALEGKERVFEAIT